jgi:hypothetical protein
MLKKSNKFPIFQTYTKPAVLKIFCKLVKFRLKKYLWIFHVPDQRLKSGLSNAKHRIFFRYTRPATPTNIFGEWTKNILEH